MKRVSCRERDGWQDLAAEYGFHFHTMYGRAYWDESAYYQFTLQEKLIDRFARLKPPVPGDSLYLSCCKDTEEDRGTVQYLEDCAIQAGLSCRFIYIEDIGHGEGDWLIDQEGGIINSLFKLYPWEFMFREEYGVLLDRAAVRFMEPPWKALVSNKAILSLLWKFFPRHPNLLPAFFENDPQASELREYVRKPIFSREGWNVSIVQSGRETYSIDGPYGEEGFILQGDQPLPRFGDNYTLIGSWLIDDQPAGISIREDTSPVTHDLSRFLPHIIG